MSTNNICLHGEIRKYQHLFGEFISVIRTKLSLEYAPNWKPSIADHESWSGCSLFVYGICTVFLVLPV